jgi:hypothetical protein
MAVDINKGYAFTPTDRVTNTKLNNLVDLATIDPSFITGKASQTPVSGDKFIFVNGSTFYYCTLSTMMLANTLLITAQTEDTTPATGDYLLTYDISAGAYKKTQLMSAIFTNAFLINGRTNWATPPRITTELLAFDTGTGGYFKLTRSNLFYQFFEFNTWTNQGLYLTPSNQDSIAVFSAALGTNVQTTVVALNTNKLIVTTNSPAGFIYGESNGIPIKMTFNSLSNTVYANMVSSGFTSTNQTFVTTNFPLSNYSGAATNCQNAAHGLGTKPTIVKAVLECILADLGYSAGDEVDIASVEHYSGSFSGQAISFGANATNVFAYIAGSDGNVYMRANYSGSSTPLTKVRWRLKVYARP